MQNKKFLCIRIVKNEDEKLKAMVVRALVYMAEQNCPFDEEFDLNDYTATQILGTIDNEPILTARIRYFGDFAKLERLAVRSEYRGFGYGQQLLDFMLNICAKKGYKRIYLHAQEGKEEFYYKNGFRKKDGFFMFSGYRYSEMYIDLPILEKVLNLNCTAMLLNRPEGCWDSAGPLENKHSTKLAIVGTNATN